MDQRIPGYRKKPIWIYVIAFFYFLTPVFTLIQLIQKTGTAPDVLKQVLLSDFFIFDLFAGVTAGIAVWIVTRPSFFYLIGLSVYTIALRTINLWHSPLFESPLELILTIFWFCITALFLSTFLKAPYLNPKLRWWTQPKRYAFFVRGCILARNIRFPVITLNLSQGGAFIKPDERVLSQPGSGGTQNLAREERATVPLGRVMLSDPEIEMARLNLSQFPQHLGEKIAIQVQAHDTFDIDAEVVWVSKPNSPYRYGVGLRYIFKTPDDKKKMQELVRFIRQAGSAKEAR